MKNKVNRNVVLLTWGAIYGLAIFLNGTESQKVKPARKNCCPRSGPFSCYGKGPCDLFCCNCQNGCARDFDNYQTVSLFDEMNTDGDDSLTLDEITDHLVKLFYFPKEAILNMELEGHTLPNLFALADEDTNGKVDRPEFEKLKRRIPLLSSIFEPETASENLDEIPSTTTISTLRNSERFEIVNGTIRLKQPKIIQSQTEIPRPKMLIKIERSSYEFHISKVDVAKPGAFEAADPGSANKDKSSEVSVLLNENDADVLSFDTNFQIHWDSIDPDNSDGSFQNANKTSLVFDTKDNTIYHVGIACTAPYLTRWRTDIPSKGRFGKKHYFGFENFDEASMNPLKLRNTSTYEVWVSSGLSGVLSCESITEPTLNTQIYIYGRGPTIFVSCPSKTNNIQAERLETAVVNWLVKGKFNMYDFMPLASYYSSIAKIIVDSNQDGEGRRKFIIPCKSNYPDVTNKNVRRELKLFEQKHFTSQFLLERVSKVIQFSTRANSKDISDSVTYDPTEGFLVEDSGVYPTKYICEFDDHPNGLKIDKNSAENSSTQTSEFIVYGTGVSKPSGELITGIYKYNHDNTRIESSWVPTGISCINSHFSQVVIAIKPCSSPFECEQQDLCFGIEEGLAGEAPQLSYRGIDTPYNHGIAYCSDINLMSMPSIDYTFIGLDKNRYWVSKPIPERALINIHEIEPILHTNNPVRFSCEISTFLLRPSDIKFIAVVKGDEKSQEIQPALVNVVLDESNFNESNYQEFTDLGFVLKEVSMTVTKDMVAIVCTAPWYNNETRLLSASRTFEARDVFKPMIKVESSELENSELTSTCDPTTNRETICVKVQKITLNKNANTESQVLHCEAEGEPSPTISWRTKNPELMNVIYFTNTTGESFLKFKTIDESIQGRYTCVATNESGEDSYDYDVSVQDSSLSSWGITGIALGSIALLILTICFIGLIRKYNYVKTRLRDLTDEEVDEFTNGRPGAGETSGGTIDISMLPFNKNYILPPQHLMIEKSAVLGQGQYGVVYRGLLKGTAVAVKTTKPNAEVLYVKSLLSELKIMGYIGKHENIVEFLGAVINQIRERNIQAVVELSPLGSLHSYLKKLRTGEDGLEFVNLLKNDVIQGSPENIGSLLGADSNNRPKDKITTIHLLEWCKQIAAGMEFLASKRVVHADLATRNVLVFPGNLMKVSDFGLSRQLYACATYVKKQKTQLPWRWMALESLRYMEFSLESDVWSYGVTVWEIFSMGQVPYPGLLTWTNEFVNILAGGMRMPKPDLLPKNIYDIVLNCWNGVPEERPSFVTLAETFDSILAPFIVNHQENQDDTTAKKSSVYVDLI